MAQTTSSKKAPGAKRRATAGPERTTRARQRKERTPEQLERQERAFNMSVNLMLSHRAIAKALHVDKKTVASDIQAEYELRREQNAADREQRKERSIARYENIIQSMQRHVRDPIAGPNAAGQILKALERIDKLNGDDAPTKIDHSIEGLKAAMAGKVGIDDLIQRAMDGG